jgi:hypothetical protein
MTTGAVTGDVRVWLRIENLVVLVLSLLAYAHFGRSWWLFAVLLFVPDLSMFGYLINARVGAVSYNVVHSYALPVSLLIFAMATGRESILPFACIWTAHIGLDRMLGYGLKYRTAFQATHLGMIGKR